MQRTGFYMADFILRFLNDAQPPKTFASLDKVHHRSTDGNRMPLSSLSQGYARLPLILRDQQLGEGTFAKVFATSNGKIVFKELKKGQLRHSTLLMRLYFGKTASELFAAGDAWSFDLLRKEDVASFQAIQREMRSLRADEGFQHLQRVLHFSPKPCGLYLERYSCDLWSHFLRHEEEFLPDSQLWRSVARQLCDGLRYMHSQGLKHLDLKPNNVLCNVLADGSLQCYIADFDTLSDADEAKGPIGATELQAPEIVPRDMSQKHEAVALDHYGLACTLVLVTCIAKRAEVLQQNADVCDGWCRYTGGLQHARKCPRWRKLRCPSSATYDALAGIMDTLTRKQHFEALCSALHSKKRGRN